MSITLRVLSFIPHTQNFSKIVHQCMVHSQGFTSAVEVDSESIETVWILNAKVKVWSIVAGEWMSSAMGLLWWSTSRKVTWDPPGGQNVGDNEKIKQQALSHVQALGVGPSHKSCLSQHIATLFTQVSDKLAEKLLPSKHTNSNYAFWYLFLVKFFWENAIVNILQNIFGLSNAFTHKMIKDVHKH